MVFCNGCHLIHNVRHYSFCNNTNKLLQSVLLVKIILSNYFLAGVTELYLSWLFTKLYPLLIHYITIPNPNTLANSTLSSYLAEVSFHIAFSHNSISKAVVKNWVLPSVTWQRESIRIGQNQLTIINQILLSRNQYLIYIRYNGCFLYFHPFQPSMTR